MPKQFTLAHPSHTRVRHTHMLTHDMHALTLKHVRTHTIKTGYIYNLYSKLILIH